MIDCHAHISHSIFDQDRKKVITQAQRAGVKTIIAVGEDIDDSRLILKMCRKYPGVLLPCMGIHPDAFAEDRKAPSDVDIVNIISKIKRESEEKVRNITTQNAQMLFGLD